MSILIILWLLFGTAVVVWVRRNQPGHPLSIFDVLGVLAQYDPIEEAETILKEEAR